MKINIFAMTALVALLAAPAGIAATTWVEGKHYTDLSGLSPSTLAPGQKEVIEVFSYGCPACAAFNSAAHKLQQGLPKGTTFTYIPAAFNPSEDWPMFQRAYLAARKLGVADKAHDAMFDAVWKGGELAVSDATTGRLRSPLPTIEDAARFYSKQTGVKTADFLAVANSFALTKDIKEADEFIKKYRIDSTPTIVVNRRYRTDVRSAGSYDSLVELVNWLVAKDGK